MQYLSARIDSQRIEFAKEVPLGAQGKLDHYAGWTRLASGVHRLGLVI